MGDEHDRIIISTPLEEAALMLTPAGARIEAMKTGAHLKVIDLLPRIEESPKSINLVTHLQFYHYCKSSYCYVFKTIYHVFSLEDLKIEELTLETEFNFCDVEDARTNFRFLVLRRMKEEVRILNITLHPLYIDEMELFNFASLHSDIFDSIPSPDRSSRGLIRAITLHPEVPLLLQRRPSPHCPTTRMMRVVMMTP